MKDPIALSLPIYPPFLPSKPSLSTNRDNHLIPLPSHDRFIFKAQLTSLSMHPTHYTFRLYDKNQDFFTSIASKIMSPYQYLLDNGVKIFFNSICFAHPTTIKKRMNVILHISQSHKKSLIVKRTLNFFNIPNHRTIFS